MLALMAPNFVLPCSILHWNVYVPGVDGAVNVAVKSPFALGATLGLAIDACPHEFVPTGANA